MHYNLPDGKTTSSKSVYVTEWRHAGDKLAYHLDCKVGAFDPGFLLVFRDGKSVDVPMLLANKILSAIEDPKPNSSLKL